MVYQKLNDESIARKAILNLVGVWDCFLLRGDIGGSAKKVGLRIKELERIYGIEHGNNQRTSNNYKSSKSQEELATDLGISIPTLQNYKQLANMIPELSELE